MIRPLADRIAATQRHLKATHAVLVRAAASLKQESPSGRMGPQADAEVAASLDVINVFTEMEVTLRRLVIGLRHASEQIGLTLKDGDTERLRAIDFEGFTDAVVHLDPEIWPLPIAGEPKARIRQVSHQICGPLFHIMAACGADPIEAVLVAEAAMLQATMNWSVPRKSSVSAIMTVACERLLSKALEMDAELTKMREAQAQAQAQAPAAHKAPDAKFHTETMTAASRGYIRRAELSDDKVDIWESPDGKLTAVPKGTVLNFVRRVDPT